MARKAEEYVIGILFPYEERTEIKYVTNILNEVKVAKWEDGEEAMTFSKAYARDLAWALSFNGNPAIVMLKESYLTLKNPNTVENKIKLCDVVGMEIHITMMYLNHKKSAMKNRKDWTKLKRNIEKRKLII